MSDEARDFNNIETRAVIKVFFSFLQGKAPKKTDRNITYRYKIVYASKQSVAVNGPIFYIFCARVFVCNLSYLARNAHARH
jgi:hypothetical protein